ncbi:MAG: hypothetical protein AB8I08_39505 [Sandaracinaceae bacterium]
MTKFGFLARVAAVMVAWGAVGCGEEAATDTTETTTTAETPPAPEPADEGPAGPMVEDPTFELRAEASGPYSAGESGTFQIRLTPRGEYHVNQDFPMAIALTGPDGMTLPPEDLSNGDAAEFSETTARYEVPFTAPEGEHTVTAEVDFAVCTPEACMPDHRTLALVLPVR